MPEARLFLERRSYRRRRIMDAVRMLPFLCALLWMAVPAMWPNDAGGTEAMPLSVALRYVFIIWLLTITASFALWGRTGREDRASADTSARPKA